MFILKSCADPGFLFSLHSLSLPPSQTFVMQTNWLTGMLLLYYIDFRSNWAIHIPEYPDRELFLHFIIMTIQMKIWKDILQWISILG